MNQKELMMTDNIVELKYDKDKNKALLEQAIRDIPNIIAFSKLKAKVYRIEYLAYVDQGFTKEQSLKLCMYNEIE